MVGCWVVVGSVIAHFEVVVVVHVGLEEERDSCNLVEESPGMVVVVVGILGMLMVEEGMLCIILAISRLYKKTSSYVCRSDDWHTCGSWRC